MAGENKNTNVNLTKLGTGMNTDTHPMYQPKGTYRFAKNAVIESTDNIGVLANEEGNDFYANIPYGYTIIGSCNINDENIALFLINWDGKISEIGILNKIKEYKTIVNDLYSVHKLKFRSDKPIQAVYRLVRGCEKVIYFTDNYNKPRYFNFDKLNDFKTSGLWNGIKFNIQNTYNSIPIFKSLRVLDEGGVLLSGSYSVAIQYLDEQLNPTEWVNTSDMVRIYVDKGTEFNELTGSINSDTDVLNFPITTKAIEIKLDDLDTNFSFYRLGFIESTSGNGEVTRVTISSQISTKQKVFVYTGNNVVGTIPKEELALSLNTIYTAGSIEQIENRLLLANTTGKNIDYCKLQRYASRINADCIVHKHEANVLYKKANKEYNTANIKNSVQEIVGFMAGEIYSFGIVYIFKDNSLSPVFHIPGRSPLAPTNKVYSKGYPMSNDNTLDNTFYDESNSCSGKDYWGLDGEGNSLKNKNVRHHRFPLRSDINKSLVITKNGENSTINYININIKVTGENPIKPDEDVEYIIKVKYKVGNNNYEEIFEIETSDFSDVGYYKEFNTELFVLPTSINNVDIRVIYPDEIESIIPYNISTDIIDTGLKIHWNFAKPSETKREKIYEVNTLGIRFSNIDVPKLNDGIEENEIIGYYIVRNERTEQEKTILDNGVLTQSMDNKKYISHGLLHPETEKISNQSSEYKLNKKVYGIIHPEHKFNNKHYRNFDELIVQGNYLGTYIKNGKVMNNSFIGKVIVPDVLSSTAGDVKLDNEEVGPHEDGFDLNIASRDTILSYQKVNKKIIKVEDEINDVFYLDALESKSIENATKEVYNITTDNKIGIVEFKNESSMPNNYKLPYVTMKRNLASPYANFKILPYYKCTINPVFFKDLDPDKNKRFTDTYSGDSYIAPMKYVNSVFYDNRMRMSPKKKFGFNVVVGAILIVVGAILAPITGGTSAILIGAGIAIAGGGILLFSSGLKADKFNKVYEEEYKKGLRDTALDYMFDLIYRYRNIAPWLPPMFIKIGNANHSGHDGPSKHSIQWIADCLSDIWIESSVNIGLRNGFSTQEAPTYLNGIGLLERLQDKPQEVHNSTGRKLTTGHVDRETSHRPPVASLEHHMIKKLTTYDMGKNGNRSYIGFALGEYYNINPDYHKQAREKWFYHLAQEYDCCSECREKFPHRVHYSEQSFQEELLDNYKIFLPNNYRDIDGETGVITNMFSIKNDLFIHTEEALWQMPRNYQERITDQMVSFIGTGSYFEIPPRKIIDSSVGASAGSRHKWATLKTPQGVFFVSENQRKIYLFNGQLQPISDMGMSKWFYDNLWLKFDKTYLETKKKVYPYRDNPQSIVGTGFLSVYDYQKDRFIITKKDYYEIFQRNRLITENDEFFLVGDKVIYYKDIDNIIQEQEADGYFFEGVKDGSLVFTKDITTEQTIEIGNRPIKPIEKNYEIESDEDEDEGVIIIIGDDDDVEEQDLEEQIIKELDTEIKIITGEVKEWYLQNDTCHWTLSFSMKTKGWVSFHNYYPNFYIHTANSFYSFTIGYYGYVFKHNSRKHFCVFYNLLKPYTIEYVSVSNPLITRIWDSISFIVDVENFETTLVENHDYYKKYKDRNNDFFNNILLYNSRQCSGWLKLVLKNEETPTEDYLYQQIENTDPEKIIVDRNERNWTINNFRDIRVNYTTPFIEDYIYPSSDVNGELVLNTSTLNVNKEWTELEPFRDKYLIIRIKADYKSNHRYNRLSFHLSMENEVISGR